MNDSKLIEEFSKADTSDFPDFYSYEKPLEMGLWVLWVAKEKLRINRLTGEQVASIIRSVQEISIDAKSIINAFNRAAGRVHTYSEEGGVYFEIMKPGKNHLVAQLKQGSVEVTYFEPDRRYTSKRLLSKNIFAGLKGTELKIVDPYCGQRCLDILSDVKNRHIKFLTKVEKLDEKERNRFLRELRDFKSENPDMEFRNYPYADIHDRYVISSDSLVLLGHSIKSLGSRESFAIVLNRDTNKNIVETVVENFDRRWEQSEVL